MAPLKPGTSKQPTQGSLETMLPSPTSSRDNPLICAYRQEGLLCYSHASQQLSLLSPTPSTGPEQQWSLLTTVSLVPAPPVSLDAVEILPSPNGSLVLLMGKRVVLLVEM